MLFAVVHFPAIQVATSNVQVGPGFLRNWLLAAFSPHHAAQPTKGFPKISAHHRGQSEVMRYQPDVMLVALFLSRLQSDAKLSLSRGPITERNQAQPARVAALCAYDGGWLTQAYCAVEVFEGRPMVAAPARDGGQRMQGFCFAFTIGAIAE